MYTCFTNHFTMQRIIAISLGLLLLGFGCSQEAKDPNSNYFSSKTSGYSFSYPKEHWTISHPYLGEGKAGNGVPHADYDNTHVLIFHKVAAASDLTQDNPTLVVTDTKYPGSTLLSSEPFTNPGQTIMKTKYQKEEHTWIVIPAPKEEASIVIEVLNPIAPPYPPLYEDGVEQILRTIKPL